MTGAHVQYIGFATKGTLREYTLRVRLAATDPQDVTLAIPNEAFVNHRVRYQDGPDICFLKLQRELVALEGAFPAAYLNVTDAELEEYRVAHTPKPPQRRPKPQTTS